MICDRAFPYDLLLSLLQNNDTVFTTPLSESLKKRGSTVEAYALKLSKTATIAYEKDESGIIKGLIAGYTENLPEGNGSYIAQVFTVPEYQRQGVCGRLLREYCDYCLQKGIQYVWLTTSVSNAAAQATYERAGFMRVPFDSPSLVMFRKTLTLDK